MSEDDTTILVQPHNTRALLVKVRAKRQDIADYLAKIRPRNSRLINASIWSGAIAAALTAGPGIGGDGFVDAIKDQVSFGIPGWQVLCLCASLLSIASVVANGMMKSHDLGSQIASASACDAKLEGLETLLELGQIDLKQAATDYAKYLAEIPQI